MLSWENNNNNKIILYHGTNNPDIIPEYGKGKSLNDYGKGFYTTTNEELAKEWAMNKFVGTNVLDRSCLTLELNTTNLKVLDLNVYEPVHWVATLLNNRGFKRRAEDNIWGGRLLDIENSIPFFTKKYAIDVTEYDYIKGFRADDGYNNFINLFLLDLVNIDELDEIMRKGDLGQQYCIKSRKAFDSLKIIGAEKVPLNYSIKHDTRLAKANKEVDKIMKTRSNRLIFEGFGKIKTNTYSYIINRILDEIREE